MSGGVDWATQPRQIRSNIRMERRIVVNRYRLSIANELTDYLTADEGCSTWAWHSGDYPARRSCSAESRVFIDPERNPSRSSVTNLKPSALKMAVNSAAIAG